VPDEATKDKSPQGPPPEDAPRAESGAESAAESAGTVDEARQPSDPEEGEDDEEGEEEQDLASPEAIARRVAVFGEEDEVERFARDEEAKLAARRKAQRKGKKKAGLEAAASKRLAKIGAKATVKRALPTVAEGDAFIDRAVKIGDWAKQNEGLVSAIVGGAIIAALGAGIYVYVEKRHETQASVKLVKALEDEQGRIGDPDKEDEDGRTHDPRLVFKTVEDRREAAVHAYRDVASKFKGTGAATLARLAEGSLLLDKHDVAGAKSAFQDVRDSPLAKADAEVRGRALESLGFAYELEADGTSPAPPGDARSAALEECSKIFRELENTDTKGFKELGMYHQARIFEKQGDKSKAIEMLKKLHERLTQAGDNHAFVYLEYVTDERLRALDPTALPPKAAGQLGGPGQNQLSQAQLRRMIEQAKKGQGKTPGGGPAGPPIPQPEDLPP
jgi:hypothetical protein